MKVALTVAACAGVAAITATIIGSPSAVTGSGGITFDHATVNDPVRMVGEPDIIIDNHGGIYVSGPGGSTTQTSWFWKSGDGGLQWHLIGCPDKSNCQNGGGDTEIVIGRNRDVFATDLQTLVCNSALRSTDEGLTFTTSEACFPGTDRQWMGIYDPNGSATGRRIYLAANGQTQGCYCLVSTDNGLTYLPPDPSGNPDATAGTGADCIGRMAIDPNNGHIFLPQSGGRTVVSTDGGMTWQSRGTSGAQAHFFATLQLDTAGNLYQAWTEGSKAFLSYSLDRGATWHSKIQVSTGPTSPIGTSPDLRQMLFPWLAVGDPGRVAVVFYGTTDTGTTSGFPGSPNALWHAYATLSTNALDANPTFNQVQATEHVMHRGTICTGGFPGCLEANADRSMADFFMVDKDAQGRVFIAYNENSDLSLVVPAPAEYIGKPINAVIRLRTGPSLFAAQGNLLPDPAPANIAITSASASAGNLSVTGTQGLPPGNWTPDAAGDAKFPVIPVTSANHPALDILEASARDDGTNLTIQLTMADLSATALADAATAGGTPSWMVTWWEGKNGIGPAGLTSGPFHSHWFVKWLGQSAFVYGKVSSIDFAALGAPTPKFLTYVPAGTASGTVTGNNVTISVPLSAVGPLSPGDKIDHVTAYSLLEHTDPTLNDWADQAKTFSYVIGTPPVRQHSADGYVQVSMDGFATSTIATLSSANNTWTATIPGATSGTVCARQVLSRELYTPEWDDVQAGPIACFNLAAATATPTRTLVPPTATPTPTPTLAPPTPTPTPTPMNAPGFHAPVAMPGSSGGSEPSVAVARQGRAGTRFVSWQNPGEVATSSDGVNFVNRGLPDSGGGGDVTNAIDPSGAFFLGQFCGGAFELHACLERSIDGGASWPLKTDFADMHPGAADRPWVEVYPHKSATVPWNPDATRVYLEYHTFSPEELAYVTVSQDGGHTFSEPKLITSDTNALVGSGCNTIPGGVAVDERDGTVYALWLSGNDVASNALTGCNYSQIGPFNKAWVSTSTDGGQTWVSHLAWQGVMDVLTRTGDNADKTFATLAVDSAGQVHVAIPVRHGDDPAGFVAACTANATTCEESAQDTDLILTTSPDRGAHWTPAVNIENNFGSYFFPWITAGSQGIVDAVYYKSASRQPNKRTSVWHIGFTQVTGAVATYTSGANAVYTRTPQFTETLLDPNPVHGDGTTGGGICTFGLFCTALMSNGDRSLADSIAITLDPAGGANAVWTDNIGNDPNNPHSTAREIHFGCQNSGRGALGGPNLNGCYGPADLAITATDSPDPIVPGGTLTYHLTVTNKGANGSPSTTSGVTLTDVLPSSVTLLSATPSVGSCSGTGTVTCDLGIFPGGAAATVDIAVSVSPQTSGSLTNAATVSALTADPDVSNNTASTTTAVSNRGLTALAPAQMWVGLANSNDVGIRFDLLAQVFRNGTLIGSGQVNSVSGGSTGFSNAILDAIPLTLSAPVDFPPGTTLGYSLSARNACSGSGKNTGAARLWYGGRPIDTGSSRDAGSRFDATIGGTSRDYFLRSGFALNTVNGTSKLTIDKAVGARCGAFVSFGTWTVKVP